MKMNDYSIFNENNIGNSFPKLIPNKNLQLTAPAFAFTTSVPAFWIRSVNFFTSSSENLQDGFA